MNLPGPSYLVRSYWFVSYRYNFQSHRQCRSSYKKRDPYEILDLKRDATQSEIKNAFYKMSKKFHPDVAAVDDQSTKRFLEVQEAYNCIRHEEKRPHIPLSAPINSRFPNGVRSAKSTGPGIAKAGLFYDPWEESAREDKRRRKMFVISILIFSFILANLLFARSPYEILGLKKNASQSEIKNAFYTLSKKYHPDITGSSAESARKFLEIKEAYDTIKDEGKRKQYDESFTSPKGRQQYGRSYQQQPRDSRYGAGNDWFKEYQQNYSYGRTTYDSPFQRNQRTYTKEDFERIWRQMHGQQFRIDFSEFIRRATQQARQDFDRQEKKRWQKTAEQTDEERASNQQIRRNVGIINKVISLYIVVFALSFIYQMFRKKNPIESRGHGDYRSSSERISRMMNKPPN